MSLKPDVQQAFPGSTKQYVIYYYLEAAGCYLNSKQRDQDSNQSCHQPIK